MSDNSWIESLQPEDFNDQSSETIRKNMLLEIEQGQKDIISQVVQYHSMLLATQLPLELVTEMTLQYHGLLIGHNAAVHLMNIYGIEDGDDIEDD